MGIEGRLTEVGLADIAQLLAMGRKSGCLTVTHRTNFGYIYFEDGRVIFATVLNRPDRLGDLLVRNSVITREDLTGAVRAQGESPGRRLGKLLVERGALAEADLRKYITIQIEEAVYHLLTWEEGHFHFAPDQRPDADPAMLVDVPVENLLLEGARRVDELSLIEKKISSRDLIYSAEPRVEGGEEADLAPEQTKLLPLLDGTRTVEEVIELSGLVEFEALKGIYGLLQAGIVRAEGRRVGGGGEQQAPAVHQKLNLGDAFYRAGMLEEAAAEYAAVVALEPENPAARSRLGVIALRSGRPEAALTHFEAFQGSGNGESIGRILNHALALELLARYEEARAILDGVPQGKRTDPRVLLARAILLLKSGEFTDAVTAFREAREKSSGEARLPATYYSYGLLAHAAVGEVDEAIRMGREGLASYPGCAPLLVNLGVVLERKGDAAAAEALYLRAVRQVPPSAQAHRNLGDVAHARGDQAGARAHYERAVRLEPRLGEDLYLKLGNLAYEEGDRDWARQHWEKALELNPGDETIRTNLDLISAAPGS
jgi:tetratricopeptide (TPR) repeat protein